MREPEPKADLDDESGTYPSAETTKARMLRERAQARLQSAHIPEDLRDVSTEAAKSLLHELRVHQIELELQNEELRSSQEALEESRARFFDLYDLAPVGYVTISANGLVQEANLTATTLLNIPRSALLKQPWTRFVLAEDQDIYLMHCRRLLASGAPDGCELRLLKSNGDPFWVRLEARLVNSTGACRTVLSDISERKQFEATLATSEARYRVLFESSAAALLTVSPVSGQVLSVNASAIAMLGAHDRAGLVSQTFASCSPSRQPSGLNSAREIGRVLALAMQNGAHSCEWTFLRGNGQAFCAKLVLARMQADAEPFLQATLRDETEAQEQHVVATQKERLASMGLLAASVGHEINNPLAYVLSNMQSLVEELPQVEGASAADAQTLQAAGERARDALEGVQRITRISAILNAFSRAEVGVLHEVNLQSAIESALSLAHNEIRFRATVVTEFEPLPTVWASEGKLSQVFLNLLLNAAHAMGEGGLEGCTITIRTWAASGNIFAEVRDMGRGIAPENLARVFEPFFSTKLLGVGVGLGLSICRNIIDELGGDIAVESKVLQGTRFIVRLPVHIEATEQQPRLARAGGAGLAAFHGRVLIIDDEEPLRRVMKRLLVSCHHDVVTASSGQEAQAILEQDQAFDLILCDLMMPDVTGTDVHRWLMERNPTLAKRIVFITGGSFGPVASEYLARAGNLTLEKPFDNGAFTEIVSERVRDAKSEPPSAGSTKPGE